MLHPYRCSLAHRGRFSKIVFPVVAWLVPESEQVSDARVSGSGHSNQTSYSQGADQSHFHGGNFPFAQVARMQIVPGGMPCFYNFYVIIT
jgi:hypothetical protein